MYVRIDQRWRVRARSAIELPLSTAAMWDRMRDFRRFLTIDPLHAAVDALPSERRHARADPTGIRLCIRHRVLGIGPDRIGCMLRWREGVGFAFSDLSSRGVRVGFPHVCMYELSALGPNRCNLIVSARGKWTARWMPRWLASLWLQWVMFETERSIRAEFMSRKS